MADLRVIDAAPVSKSIIEVLEEALEKAKNDDLSSVAIAWIYRDGAPGWNWSETPNTSTMIGAIERLKADIIRNIDE